MNNLLKHLQTLHEQELYSNIVKVCDLAFTIGEQKPDTFTFPVKFQFTLYYADALYQTQQYVQAENLYRQSLQLRKNLNTKTKNSNSKLNDKLYDFASDVDIKYKIHLCCLALRQKKAAADILQTISARQRTSKINMALGNICKDAGMERSAITCFKEVLRECPLALEAVENLLKLGVKGIEVNALLVEVSSEVSWLGSWLKAQAQLYARDFTGAIQTYKSMDTHGLLKDNTSLLVNMAYCYHYMCEDNKAIAILQKAMRLEPNLLFGKDLLSTLLAASGTKEHQHALENLAPNTDTSLWSTEHWVVLGNLMYSLKKYDKAAYFGHQALHLDGRNIEALLLKANTFVQMKKYQEATVHCNEALQLCNFRYDIHKCLVDCYIQTNRLREAEGVAFTACQQLNRSAWGYCLHASVLLKDPMASSSQKGQNVRRILEKAVAQDKSRSTNALYMLVEHLEHEQQHSEAVQILLKAIENGKPTSRMHQLLGDCFVSLQKDEESFNHYTIALKLDPQNQRAAEGLNNIGRNLSISKRESYYNSATNDAYKSQVSTSSDHEADPESDDNWPGACDLGNFD